MAWICSAIQQGFVLLFIPRESAPFCGFRGKGSGRQILRFAQDDNDRI
jgi:hypothetical protein